MKTGDDTPWGPAQTVEEIAEGITAVSTASHGGILLSKERQAAILPGLIGRNHYGRELPRDLPGGLGSSKADRQEVLRCRNREEVTYPWMMM